MTLIDIYDGWHELDPNTVVITPTGFSVVFQLASDDTVHLGLEIGDDRLGTLVMTLTRTRLHELYETLTHVVNATDVEVEALIGTLKHGPAE